MLPRVPSAYMPRRRRLNAVRGGYLALRNDERDDYGASDHYRARL